VKLAFRSECTRFENLSMRRDEPVDEL
jgi:hypothetical protein